MSIIINNSADLVSWVWKCRDCQKEYSETFKFSTTPYKCVCGGIVDLCVKDTVSLSGYNADEVKSN